MHANLRERGEKKGDNMERERDMTKLKKSIQLGQTNIRGIRMKRKSEKENENA